MLWLLSHPSWEGKEQTYIQLVNAVIRWLLFPRWLDEWYFIAISVMQSKKCSEVVLHITFAIITPSWHDTMIDCCWVIYHKLLVDQMYTSEKTKLSIKEIELVRLSLKLILSELVWSRGVSLKLSLPFSNGTLESFAVLSLTKFLKLGFLSLNSWENVWLILCTSSQSYE